MANPNRKQLVSEKPIFTQLQCEDLLEAVAELGVMHNALQAVGLDRKTVWRMEQADPTFAMRLREARIRGQENRIDYLEACLFKMAPTVPAAAMFLLKKLDPSYRESYNVTSSSTPTNYTIDLSLPAGDDTPHDADQSTTTLLE